ncbi:hypothetical protein BX666DRAFT_2027268 [Dichotomocladium elegans]|nr:hypothetical protein BX666DRAFT_2027268 [Dichotomocladium elegans]
MSQTITNDPTSSQRHSHFSTVHGTFSRDPDPGVRHSLESNHTDAARLHNRPSEQTLKHPPTVQSKPSDTTLRDPHHNPEFWTQLTHDLNAAAMKKKITEHHRQHTSNDWYHGYDFNTTQASPSPEPWWVVGDDPDGVVSIGAFLFLFGFLCPPLWWIGSFWPRHARHKGGKLADRWQKLCRLMTICFGALVIIAVVILAIVLKTIH